MGAVWVLAPLFSGFVRVSEQGWGEGAQVPGHREESQEQMAPIAFFPSRLPRRVLTIQGVLQMPGLCGVTVSPPHLLEHSARSAWALSPGVQRERAGNPLLFVTRENGLCDCPLGRKGLFQKRDL